MFTAALLTLAAISAPPADYVLIERVDYVLIPIERSVVVKRTTRPAAPAVVVTRSAVPVAVGPVYAACALLPGGAEHVVLAVGIYVPGQGRLLRRRCLRVWELPLMTGGSHGPSTGSR
jgi:hypothetical protein